MNRDRRTRLATNRWHDSRVQFRGAYTLAGVHTEVARPAELNDRYSQLLKAQKTKQSTSKRRRAASRAKDLKGGPYKLPQIVVVSERTPRGSRSL